MLQQIFPKAVASPHFPQMPVVAEERKRTAMPQLYLGCLRLGFNTVISIHCHHYFRLFINELWPDCG